MAFPARNWSSRSSFVSTTPVTLAVLLIWVVVLLCDLVGVRVGELLVFSPAVLPNYLIGIVTYPLLPGGLFDVLLTGYMWWLFAGSVERAWGWREFLIFLLVSNAAALVVWEVGIFLFTGHLIPLATTWMMVAAVVVAWAWMNPDAEVLFAFFIPMKAKWVAYLMMAFPFFLLPNLVPVALGVRLLLGVFTLGGAATAWLYHTYRHNSAWRPRRGQPHPTRRVLRHPASHPFDFIMRPFREWQRRRRIAYLEKTFKFDDDEQRKSN